ncbi:SRPBCC family protein [Listeria sp. PSOL-1]|uniref:SRPBCC family protein n=1 Tax=Listeria sp. PSOL-1 TaxID=1844999 RepID=UPI0013D27303|nr:SRPBCC family protein [Listeria sp. PSOL-1]
MKFSFEVKVDATLEKVWALYEDVNKWFAWEDDLETISLEGAFTQGTQGTMKLVGQPSISFKLVSVTPNKEFTDKTTIPDMGDLYFTHELSKSGNQTQIKHSVEFIPLNRKETIEDTKFVAQIFADVPTSIFALAQAAK